MSQTPIKPLAVVFGATGETGQRIVEGLLRSKAFRIAIVARDLAKPAVSRFADQGVAIHKADLLSVTQERLEEILAGADIVIASLLPNCMDAQKKIADAGKAVGIKRFVPNDFGPSCPKGVMNLQDRKLAIHEYIESIGLGHTYIEIGWWMQISAIFPAHIKSTTADMVRNLIGSGDVPFAVVDEFHIGDYVARIIQDERTLNKKVFVWEDEVTQNQAWNLAVKKYGKGILEQKKTVRTILYVNHRGSGGPSQMMMRYVYEYWVSLFIRGDNTVANAKANGAIDFRDLYPDIKPRTFAEYVDSLDDNPYIPPQLERTIE
ncbi:NAD(P)-binding protein [Schizophyllum commune H4-8]|nr:NAD(P)-binding protein [Schizophyllum commune H4-8]KAI5890646.1 NAD(P)-binding protein [Schizophyllum commune H4-8]